MSQAIGNNQPTTPGQTGPSVAPNSPHQPAYNPDQLDNYIERTQKATLTRTPPLMDVTTTYAIELDSQADSDLPAHFIAECVEKLRQTDILVVRSRDDRLALATFRAIAQSSLIDKNYDKRMMSFTTATLSHQAQFEVLLMRDDPVTIDNGQKQLKLLLLVDATTTGANEFTTNLANLNQTGFIQLQQTTRKAWRRIVVLVDDRYSARLDALTKAGCTVVIPTPAMPMPSPSTTTEPCPVWSDELSPIDKLALFLVAFLPASNAEDFDRLMILLLGEQREALPVAAVDPNKPNGVGVTTPPRKLADVWRADRARILKRCGMRFRSVAGAHGGTVVGLREPAHTAKLREVILEEDYLFYAECIQTIEESELLFDVSEPLFKQLAEALAESADRNPRIRRDAAFTNMVRTSLLTQFLAKAPSAMATQETIRAKRSHLVNRIASLICIFRARACMQDIDIAVLEFLQAQQQHILVFEIALRLQGVDGFDLFRWVPGVLTQCSDEDTSRLLADLAWHIQLGTLRSQAALRAACVWISEPNPKVSAAGIHLVQSFATMSILSNPLEDDEDNVFCVGMMRSMLRDPSVEGRHLLATMLEAMMRPRAFAEFKESIDLHFSILVGHWLFPVQLRAQMHTNEEALLNDLTRGSLKAVADAWNQSRQTHWPGQWLFQALCWAEWAVLGHENVDDAGDETPFYQVLDELFASSRVCDRAARGALLAHWQGMEEGLNIALRAMHGFRVETATARTALLEMRELLKRRYRHVRVLRERTIRHRNA